LPWCLNRRACPGPATLRSGREPDGGFRGKSARQSSRLASVSERGAISIGVRSRGHAHHHGVAGATRVPSPAKRKPLVRVRLNAGSGAPEAIAAIGAVECGHLAFPSVSPVSWRETFWLRPVAGEHLPFAPRRGQVGIGMEKCVKLRARARVPLRITARWGRSPQDCHLATRRSQRWTRRPTQEATEIDRVAPGDAEGDPH